jgi:hypothetical protein
MCIVLKNVLRSICRFRTSPHVPAHANFVARPRLLIYTFESIFLPRQNSKNAERRSNASPSPVFSQQLCNSFSMEANYHHFIPGSLNLHVHIEQWRIDDVVGDWQCQGNQRVRTDRNWCQMSEGGRRGSQLSFRERFKSFAALCPWNYFWCSENVGKLIRWFSLFARGSLWISRKATKVCIALRNQSTSTI